MDRDLSKARRPAASLLDHRWDIPRLYLAAARTPTKAGQHAGRSSGHAGEELFLRREHSAAASWAVHASGANVRQGGSRYTNAKPPPPIPQTIFVTKEQSVSELFLPYGRLLRCELVNTVDSTNIDTPIIGLVIEDAWNDGRLIIPAGTEVHGVAQKSAVRERIGSDRQWFLVFQDGRELPVSGTVLDYAPDPKKPNAWNESDGSAGLRGFFVKSDKYAEAKAILASMISAGAGAFPQATTLLSPLGGATQINSGGIESAFSAGLQAGGQIYSKRLLDQLDKNPFYVRVPAGATFYLYIKQTVDLGKATVGLSASLAPSSSPKQP